MMRLSDLSSRAVELAPGALGVLAELMGDEQQTGPVRVAAAKGVIDYALKLADQLHDENLSKLDEVFEDLRKVCIVEDQG